MTRRVKEFIEIGDTHLRNVKLTAYHDELLQDAIGQTVSLSVAGSLWGKGGPPGAVQADAQAMEAASRFLLTPAAA